jgi:hypothetical protein
MFDFPNNSGVSGSASNPSKSTRKLGRDERRVWSSCHTPVILTFICLHSPGGSNCARTRGTPAGFFFQEDEATVQAAWDIPAQASAGEIAVTETIRSAIETGEEYGHPTN